jgi:hypothetical protein
MQCGKKEILNKSLIGQIIIIAPKNTRLGFNWLFLAIGRLNQLSPIDTNRLFLLLPLEKLIA